MAIKPGIIKFAFLGAITSFFLTLLIIIVGALKYNITVSFSLSNNPPVANALSNSGQLKFTVDRAKIGATLSDFPVLVKLGASSGINSVDTSYVLSDLGGDANRKKISVKTEGGNELYVEIEKWDTANKQAWLWVKVPNISTTADTVLYLNYDVNGADNTAYVGDTGSAPAQNVWDTGFKAVYHMNDIGSIVKDSTRNAHNGTKLGGAPDPVLGKIGPSALFTGSNYIEIPDSDDFSLANTRHLIVSTWFSPSALVMSSARSDGQIRFLSKSDDTNKHEWAMNYYNDSAERDQGIAFYWFNLDGGLGTGHYMWPYGDSRNIIGINEWEQLTGRGDEDSAVINGYTRSHWISTYKNGEYRNGQTMNATIGINPQNGTAPITLGHSLSFDSWLKGRLDEVRIDAAPRSDAWIKADYYSQNNGLLTYTAVSSPISTSTPTPTPSPTSAPISSSSAPALLAYWKLNENTGTIASDSSGNSNTGNLINNPIWVQGKSGSALQFNGINKYVDARNPANLQLTGALTLEGWIKLNDTAANAALFGRGHGLGSDGNYGYFLTYYAPTKSLYFDTYSATARDALYLSNAITDNNWHHIAATWDGTTNSNGKKLYLDGKLVAQKASAVNSIGIPAYNFRIGLDGNGNYPLNGAIDEVKVYNKALTASEIQANYAGTTIPSPAPAPTSTPTPTPTPTLIPSLGLSAYWKFNENTGAIAADSSGKMNTGTIYGATWTAGKTGSALKFNGTTNSYVNAGNKTNLQITKAITLEGWVKLNSLSVNSGLFGRGHGLGGDGNYGYFVTYYAPTKSLYFDTYSTSTRDSLYLTNAITDNNWHHVAVTWDGTTSSNGKKLYIDGVLKTQKASSISSMGIPSYSFRIGKDSNGDYPARATIDNVKVYDRALSASEIKADMGL